MFRRTIRLAARVLPSLQTMSLLSWVLAMLVAVLTCGSAAADDRNPLAGNPKAAKAGEYEFRINCALCHGLGRAWRRPRAGSDARRRRSMCIPTRRCFRSSAMEFRERRCQPMGPTGKASG